MEYRLAGVEDIPALCRLRKLQLIDEGISPHIDIDGELERYFADKLGDGSLVEWLAEEDGKPVATAAIVFMEFPPTYTNKTGVRGYITNMYTAPAYRKKGIATAMLHRLMEEAVERRVKKLWLGASKLGRPVYLKFGFRDTGEWLDFSL